MLKIVAGDFGREVRAKILTGILGDKEIQVGSAANSGVIQENEIASVHLVTDENKMDWGGQFGAGVAGMLIARPIGAFAGSLLGGQKEAHTLAITLKDGRMLLCVADSEDCHHLLSVKVTGENEP